MKALASLTHLALALALVAGCDRATEAYDPNERPAPPDLAKIFPPGAARSQQPGGSEGAPPPGGRGAPPVAAATTGEPISGTVRLAPDQAALAAPSAVLFVIARPEAGGPPLAVKRVASPSFPLEFEIGPDDRMIQQMPFVGPLVLTARLDGDGNASTRLPGDLQGKAVESASPGDREVEIVLGDALGP